MFSYICLGFCFAFLYREISLLKIELILCNTFSHNNSNDMKYIHFQHYKKSNSNNIQL